MTATLRAGLPLAPPPVFPQMERRADNGGEACLPCGPAESSTERRLTVTAAGRRSNILLAHRLLAWSEAIEDGERRSFEEWLGC